METYRRKGVGRGNRGEVVQAIQVKRPYRKIAYSFPRSHKRTKPGGALDYIKLVDAPEDRNRAHDGDWLVKFPDGRVEVVPADEFAEFYT